MLEQVEIDYKKRVWSGFNFCMIETYPQGWCENFNKALTESLIQLARGVTELKWVAIAVTFSGASYDLIIKDKKENESLFHANFSIGHYT